MAIIMKENLKTIFLMGLVYIVLPFIMKANGIMEKNMVKVKKYGQMVSHIKENLEKVKKKDKARWSLMITLIMKGNFLETLLTVCVIPLI